MMVRQGYSSAIKSVFAIFGFFVVLVMLFTYPVIGQTTDSTCAPCSLLRNILDKLFSIEEKICGEKTLLFSQMDTYLNQQVTLRVDAPGFGTATTRKSFFIRSPEVVGVLNDIKDMSGYGISHGDIGGVSCNLSINNNPCGVMVQLEQAPDDVYVNMSGCVGYLDFIEENVLDVTCTSSTNADGDFDLNRIVYSGSWNSCM